MLRVSRYRIVGEAPSDPVCVLVAAPHTSNWDFPLMLAMAWGSGLQPVWLGKKEMFWGPVAPLFRKLGGIPVDRQNPAGLADRVAQLARNGKVSAVVIPPEATRDPAGVLPPLPPPPPLPLPRLSRLHVCMYVCK